MKTAVILTLLMSLFYSPCLAQENIYTSYPAFGDEEPYSYNDKRIAAITEKGLVRELIIQCKKNKDDTILEGIMVHDHINNVFCDSKNECHASLAQAINHTCGG